MNLEQLKELMDKQGKTWESFTIDFEGKYDFQELQDILNQHIVFFKSNEIEIKQITFWLPDLPLDKRSSLVLKFNEVLSSIKELKTLKITKPVKDYALRELLTNESLSKLEVLSLVHGKNDLQVGLVNTKDFFETTLVSYLAKNQNLKRLVIIDWEGITASEYPKLKYALCSHAKLTEFEQDRGRSFSNPLCDDPELMRAFQKKISETPEAKKAQLEFPFSWHTKRALELNATLNELNIKHKQEFPEENIWQRVGKYLSYLLTELVNLNNSYKGLNDGDPTILGRIALLEVLINYIVLVKQAVQLKDKTVTLNSTSKYPKLDLFWNVQRVDLLNEIVAIKKNNSNDFTQILNLIKVESQKLIQLKSEIMPVVYPSTYKDLCQNKDDKKDGLEQALRLLNDYTKGNSAISRFFQGHWNRHYVSEVNSIAMKVHKDIKCVGDLLAELNTINITTPNGSLARRIRYIEEHCQFSNDQENSPTHHPA